MADILIEVYKTWEIYQYSWGSVRFYALKASVYSPDLATVQLVRTWIDQQPTNGAPTPTPRFGILIIGIVICILVVLVMGAKK